MELEVTWNRALRVWWSWFWRSIVMTIAAMFCGFIAGAVLGVIGAILKLPIQAIQVGGGILGGAIGLVFTLFPIKMILGKDFGEFRLVLLSKGSPREPGGTFRAPEPYEL
jgi:uncharacterized membrane protein AbrB (regulator of aidB expression)